MPVDAYAAVVGLAMENAISPLLKTIDDQRRTIDDHAIMMAALRAEVGSLSAQITALESRAPVPGPPGPAGRDGADGLGFENVEAGFDGDRTITLAFRRGENAIEFPMVLPFLRYQGVFASGTAYRVGDVVTEGGSMWHCKADTTRQPGTPGAKDDWQLAVKRGRDGRERGRP